MAVFKKFDHIGIVVNDLEAAMKELAVFWGLTCEKQVEMQEAGIRTAFYPLGDGQMEIIEFKKPLDDVDPLAVKSGGGVQHVAFQVQDFDAALATLAARGLKPLRGFPRQGAHGRVAFFYPTAALELLVEICEARGRQDK